jgi:bacteriorhodopsin
MSELVSLIENVPGEVATLARQIDPTRGGMAQRNGSSEEKLTSSTDTKLTAQPQKFTFTEFSLFYNSFYVTFALLLTTATVTVIEALRTASPMVRHIMNLETCISIIASYFYSVFLDKLKPLDGQPLTDQHLRDMNLIRYIDWSCTTPLMLLSLSLVLAYNTQQKVSVSTYGLLVALNALMLYVGYLGSTFQISLTASTVLGFAWFAGILWVIWNTFLRGSSGSLAKRTENWIVFGVFASIWGMYGVVNLLDDYKKNIGFNVLDLVAKCMSGLLLWVYFTKIMTFGDGK